MEAPCSRVLAVLFGALAVDTAHANGPRVPTTGSQQGEIAPNALPGGGPAHVSIPEGHIVAPNGPSPQAGSTQGIQPPNSIQAREACPTRRSRTRTWPRLRAGTEFKPDTPPTRFAVRPRRHGPASVELPTRGRLTVCGMFVW